ncbi:MAG: AarF/ABC1/UbiB kinase family protein [Pseudomonadota bacterium]
MTEQPKAQPRAIPATRLSRFNQLASMTARVGGSMAGGALQDLARGQRPNMRNLLLTPSNMRRIADDLAKMRGAAMKIGQLVSMDTGDVLPPELAQIFARLRADADFMPPAQLKKVLNANWRDGWLKEFKRFDVHPIAAASIGQVHRAQLKDGRDVAIKVQYPGVAKSIDSDVSNVGALMKVSGLLPAGFELKPYLTEARRQLHEETDYALEGRQLQAFRRYLAGNEAFTLPELHEDWTTENILTMSYVAGVPIEDATRAPQDTRNQIAEHLLRLMLDELFSFQLMQTDPNFANYRYAPDTGKIILLDFGATRALDPVLVDQYRRLMRAGFTGDAQALQAVATEIGFLSNETAPHHATRILRMMQLVFEALSEEAIFDFTRTDLSDAMNAEGRALAEDGFLPPPLPMDVLYLQRKFGGMFLLCARLKAHVPVKALIETHL